MSGFPATHASVLERIRSGDDEIRTGAWGELAAGYWRPSYHYLRLHWRLAPERAEDIVQGFFTVAFEKGYLENFDPAKARFRTFLRTCLDRFLQNQQKAETALKRGGGRTLSLDFPGAERDLDRISTSLHDPDVFFRTETIRALFAEVADQLQAACHQEGRDIVYRTFALHDLAEEHGRSYGDVAAKLGIPVTQVTNHLHVARRRFRELALARLRGLVGTDAEYRDEARDLFGVEVDL